MKRFDRQRHRMVERGKGTAVICTGKAWPREGKARISVAGQGKRKDSTCAGKKWSDDAK